MQIDELKTAWEFHHNIPTIMLFLFYNERAQRGAAHCVESKRAPLYSDGVKAGEEGAKTKLTVSASITSLKFLFPAILFLMALTASLGL